MKLSQIQLEQINDLVATILSADVMVDPKGNEYYPTENETLGDDPNEDFDEDTVLMYLSRSPSGLGQEDETVLLKDLMNAMTDGNQITFSGNEWSWALFTRGAMTPLNFQKLVPA